MRRREMWIVRRKLTTDEVQRAVAAGFDPLSGVQARYLYLDPNDRHDPWVRVSYAAMFRTRNQAKQAVAKAGWQGGYEIVHPWW